MDEYLSNVTELRNITIKSIETSSNLPRYGVLKQALAAADSSISLLIPREVTNACDMKSLRNDFAQQASQWKARRDLIERAFLPIVEEVEYQYLHSKTKALEQATIFDRLSLTYVWQAAQELADEDVEASVILCMNGLRMILK